MKCVKCGAELKEGCLYCSVCGQESQVVPDYSVLEDDYLRSSLKEENQKKPKKPESKKTTPKEKPKKKRNSTAPIIVVCCILAAAIIAGAAIKASIHHKNANSYDYQVQMAENELADKNYETALSYYKTALSIQPEDIAVRLAMADIYMGQKDYDSAMVLLIEVIDLDTDNLEAYQSLIAVYEEKEDYDNIAELASGITDEDILELFVEYIVDNPIISPAEGEYDKYISVTLFSLAGDDIYYTTDGSTPDVGNGILYADEKIELDAAGEYEIQAVCCNEKGIYSDVVSASYVIHEVAPEYATVTPDGGRIYSETQVTIEAEDGCSIYYTWDGTNPTELSDKYEGPLDIPEGNNILSVLVVNDKNGLDSGVYRTNFIYYP